MYYDIWKTTDPSDNAETYAMTERAGDLQDELDRLMDDLDRKLDLMEQAGDPNWGAAYDLVHDLKWAVENALDQWEFDSAENALDDLYNAL